MNFSNIATLIPLVAALFNYFLVDDGDQKEIDDYHSAQKPLPPPQEVY